LLSDQSISSIVVAKVTACLMSVEHWSSLQRDPRRSPSVHTRRARSVVPVPASHHGYLIELEASAVR